MEHWGSEREGHPPNLYQVPRPMPGTEDKREGPDPVLRSPPACWEHPQPHICRARKAPPGTSTPQDGREGPLPAQNKPPPHPPMCLLHLFLLTAWFSTFTAVVSVKCSAICYFISPSTILLISIPGILGVDFYSPRHPKCAMSKI